MEYHCFPDNTDLDTRLWDDWEILRKVRDANDHSPYHGPAGDVERVWAGFNDEMLEAVDKRAEEGKKGKGDV